jgi:hypothetical protein
MNYIRQSLVGKYLNFFALLAFLVLQVPGAAFAASETKVTHDALKFFVPEKRIRLDAAVVDPKGVTLVRAYFKTKTQADYVFVPMEAQQSAKDSYVANLPAMAKSNDEVQYLFLVVNGANEVVKTEPFVVKAKDSKEVPSWQMVSDDGSVKLFTEVPDAPAVAASFSDSVSLNVVESGARFGLVAQIYGTSGSAAASGAAAGATNAGTAAVATAGLSTVTIVAAAAAVGGVAAAAGGGKSGGSTSVSASPTPTALTNQSIVSLWNTSGSHNSSGQTTDGKLTFNSDGSYSYTLVTHRTGGLADAPAQGVGTWALNGTNLILTFDRGAIYNGTASGNSVNFTMVSSNGWTLNFAR